MVVAPHERGNMKQFLLNKRKSSGCVAETFKKMDTGNNSAPVGVRNSGAAMKNRLGMLPFLVMLVGLCAGFLTPVAVAAETEPDPEGHGRTYTQFHNEIAGYDISPFFLNHSDEFFHRFIGFIGTDLQRFYIMFIEAKKSPDNPYLYQVRGKTRVKKNICDFTGTITVVRSGLSAASDADLPEGFILAKVDLAENAQQPGTGTVTGQMLTDFYLDKGVIHAGDVPGNQSLQFSCIWTSHKTGARKLCNFGQGRIPTTGLPKGGGVDQGDGEFVPKRQYYNKGWDLYAACREESTAVFLATQKGTVVEYSPACRKELDWWK